MSSVSGNTFEPVGRGNGKSRPQTRDRQPKAGGHKAKKVRVALISYGPGVASCNCGWSGSHPRVKVLEDKVDRHLAKAHAGQTSIRL